MSKQVYYDDASKHNLTGGKWVYVDENGNTLTREQLKDYDLSNPIYYSNPTSNPRVGNEFKGDDTQNERALAAHVQNVRKGQDNLQRIKDQALTVAGFVPIVGDALGGYQIYDDTRRGAYTAAGIGLGAMFLPSALRGVGRNISRGIKRIFTRSKIPNLSNLTESQLDDLYFKAIEDNNQKLIQQLRDYHFKLKTNQDPEVLYHGAPYGGFNIFDSHAFNSTIGGASAKGEKGNFFTTDLPAAIRYAEGSYTDSYISPYKRQSLLDRILRRPKELKHPVEQIPENFQHGILKDTQGKSPVTNNTALGRNYKRTVYPTYIKLGNTYDIDFRGLPWNKAPIKFPSKYKITITNTGGIPQSSNIFLNSTDAERVWNNIQYPFTSQFQDLNNQRFSSHQRYIYKHSGRPDYLTATLTEQRVPSTTNGAVTYANDRGYDTVIIRNVQDANVPQSELNYPITDVVSLRPQNIKLADPITYDDFGNVIPLSKRDNFNISDIRYLLIPSLMGTSLLNNQNE